MLLVALNVVAAGCIADDASESRNTEPDSTVAPGKRPAPEFVASAIDSLAARVVAEGLTPALGVAVVMDGRTILSKSNGMADVTNGVPADDRTLWYVASAIVM